MITIPAQHGTIFPQRRLTHRYHSSLLLISVVLLVSSLLVLLAACGSGSSIASITPSPTSDTVLVRNGPVHVLPAPTSSTTVVNAQRHLYIFSTTDVGLMYPAIDIQCNIWIGEMNANRLGYLNVQTGKITSWPLPDGRYGIMATVADRQGNIWYAEQFANYIGRLDPKQQVYRTFPF